MRGKVDCVWQPAQWLDPEEAPKHFPKPHCLVVCCPSDLLQLSESQWNHYIWKVCSANRWDAWKTAMPAAGTGQQNGSNSSPWQCPTTHCITMFKSWMNWAMKFCSVCLIYLTSLSPTDYHFFKHLNNFLQGKCFHNSRRQKILSKSSLNPEAGIFILQE